ncbi:MarR family transcriptional regulator [Halorussus caseinilyticus]|uniref:MarR family transcriptional regulator n=2 Tax=Halorussus caseinilyticus TaxID=3034025 RepID=A0ABD5WJA0_9EURY
MTAGDDLILTVLGSQFDPLNKELQLSPGCIAVNIDYNNDYVGTRCRKLVEAGLLEKEGQYYSISEKGRAYLAGELDASELEDE